MVEFIRYFSLFLAFGSIGLGLYSLYMLYRIIRSERDRGNEEEHIKEMIRKYEEDLVDKYNYDIIMTPSRNQTFLYEKDR